MKGFLRIVPRVEIWGPFVFFLRGTNRGCGEEERTLHGPPEAASIYQEADFSFSSLSNISSSSRFNISRGRFLIFIFVEYINLLKPQHILRQICDFHLCQIYQPPQASIYQEADFLFSSLSNISISSSFNISGDRFFIFIFVKYINLPKHQYIRRQIFIFVKYINFLKPQQYWVNISRGRFFVVLFVTNIFILKPQYVKKSFRFHLCQIYHHLQASIFQKVDFFHFHLGSLCNSCDFSSYEFVAVWCGKCCIGNGEWFKSMRRTLLEKCAS